MANYLSLIGENKVNDLSSLVFNQKLNKESKEGFTNVLSEAEENAAVQKMLDNHPNGAWRDFVVQYFNHYPPCNSTVDLLLNNADLVVARDVLKQVITMDWGGLTLDQAKKLCEIVQKEKNSFCFHLLEAYCHNPHCMVVDQSLVLMLFRIDEIYADHGDIHVKLAEIYEHTVRKGNIQSKGKTLNTQKPE
jgi:hypothetical protein